MNCNLYLVLSVLTAIKARPATEYGRYRLMNIPAGAQLEVAGESATLQGMLEARWNGQIYIVMPAELAQKAQPLVA